MPTPCFILLILGIMILECSQLTSADNAPAMTTSGSTKRECSTIGDGYWCQDLVASFRAQQLVSSTWFAQGGTVNETYEWDVYPGEDEDEGPEWVEDADANH